VLAVYIACKFVLHMSSRIIPRILFAPATGTSTGFRRWSVLELAKSTGSDFYQTARRHPEGMVFIAVQFRSTSKSSFPIPHSPITVRHCICNVKDVNESRCPIVQCPFPYLSSLSSLPVLNGRSARTALVRTTRLSNIQLRTAQSSSRDQ
jgi:hypothetical protein